MAVRGTAGDATAPSAAPAEVLLVCRANRCRSPFAAAIATRFGEGRALRFSSAGLLPAGHPVPQAGLDLARRRGYDLGAHRSRTVADGDLDGADLILTMGRDQARDLLADRDDLWPRLFTLKQFSRWIAAHPRPVDEPLRPWLERTAADRSRATVVGVDPADDVADPLAGPARAWRRMADELESHLALVVDGLTAGHIAVSTSRS